MVNATEAVNQPPRITPNEDMTMDYRTHKALQATFQTYRPRSTPIMDDGFDDTTLSDLVGTLLPGPTEQEFARFTLPKEN